MFSSQYFQTPMSSTWMFLYTFSNHCLTNHPTFRNGNIYSFHASQIQNLEKKDRITINSLYFYLVLGGLFVEVRDSPNGIFGPWAQWSRGLARWESCRRIAAAVVGVTWKLALRPVLVFGTQWVLSAREPGDLAWFNRLTVPQWAENLQ